jgi:hypothetical protein
MRLAVLLSAFNMCPKIIFFRNQTMLVTENSVVYCYVLLTPQDNKTLKPL